MVSKFYLTENIDQLTLLFDIYSFEDVSGLGELLNLVSILSFRSLVWLLFVPLLFCYSNLILNHLSTLQYLLY